MNMLSLTGAAAAAAAVITSHASPPHIPAEHLRACASAATHSCLYARIAAPLAQASDSASVQLYEACCRAQYTSAALLNMYTPKFITETLIFCLHPPLMAR